MSAAYNRSVNLQTTLTIQPNASALDTFRGIIRQDRISGLWRGVTPSILRNTMGVGFYFMSLNAITARLSSPDGTLSDAATLYSGAAARSMIVVLLCPLSVVKTRMETVEYSTQYSNVFHAIRTISRQEGYRGLFSGLVPAIVRDAPYSAMYMLIYLRTKDILGRAVGLKDTRSSIMTRQQPIPSTSSSSSTTASPSSPSSPGPAAPVGPQNAASDSPEPRPGLTRLVNFSSGALGGGLATILTQPQDVVKTRMQLTPRAPDGSIGRYSSVAEATRRVFAEEGLYGFFRGSSPRFFKRILGSAITWMVFEDTTAFYTKLLRRVKTEEQKPS